MPDTSLSLSFFFLGRGVFCLPLSKFFFSWCSNRFYSGATGISNTPQNLTCKIVFKLLCGVSSRKGSTFRKSFFLCEFIVWGFFFFLDEIICHELYCFWKKKKSKYDIHHIVSGIFEIIKILYIQYRSFHALAYDPFISHYSECNWNVWTRRPWTTGNFSAVKKIKIKE